MLEVAYETFAAEGLSVPIDEIARRAGVGAGTVYRHFPTKEALFHAVIADRMQRFIDDGHALLESVGPGEAIFSFLRSMVLQWGATDRGVVEALAGLGIDIAQAAPDAEDAFLAMLDDLLCVPPFAIAWPALLRLLHEAHGPRHEAFLAGRMPRRRYANASSPASGIIE